MPVQRRELGSVGPTRKGWTTPLGVEPGQKESVLFASTTRAIAEEVQVMLFPSGVRDYVSQGRSRVPLWPSSGALLRSAYSHVAWP